jgi:L-2-hydroxyglutarate oxidase LhgO
MDEVNITIIGSGVVGLAVAAGLSALYEDIVVLERRDSFGREMSSRNSEVIHAGIYYPAGSLKARLCVDGAERLYSLCAGLSVPHRRIGKLIAADDKSEIPALEKLFRQGKANGVKNLTLLDKAEALKLEPGIKAAAAIHSPNTGIIDSHAYMKRLYNEAEANGVMFAFDSAVDGIKAGDAGGYVIGMSSQGYSFGSRVVINCAGLASDKIAAMAGIDIDKYSYRLKPCKGSYFSYSARSPVNMLVYPVPHENLTGLGVHATLDIGGRLRFGPDTEYVSESDDYRVDKSKLDAFYLGASKIIPGLDREAFTPDMAGIRPKLQGPGEPVRDFVIREEGDKGLPGFINLIGIESPGLTASLAIAEMVKGMVKELTR